jgi:hypothetical protein
VAAGGIGDELVDLCNRPDMRNADDHHGSVELNQGGFQDALAGLASAVRQHEDAKVLGRFHTYSLL